MSIPLAKSVELRNGRAIINGVVADYWTENPRRAYAGCIVWRLRAYQVERLKSKPMKRLDRVRGRVWDRVWDRVGGRVGVRVWGRVYDRVWVRVGGRVGVRVRSVSP